MKLQIPDTSSRIPLDTTQTGKLVIEICDDKEVLTNILEAIYGVMDTKDFIATLSNDQLQEIAEYYKELNNE